MGGLRSDSITISKRWARGVEAQTIFPWDSKNEVWLQDSQRFELLRLRGLTFGSGEASELGWRLVVCWWTDLLSYWPPLFWWRDVAQNLWSWINRFQKYYEINKVFCTPLCWRDVVCNCAECQKNCAKDWSNNLRLCYRKNVDEITSIESTRRLAERKIESGYRKPSWSSKSRP